jgi:DNA polymerase I-like protein with 3'-5' exonuclease and polymerase domains
MAFAMSPEELATKDPQVERVVTADYSQIELRVLAHLSQDPLLVDSFRSGEDVHTRTAIEMFGPEEGKQSDKRRAAKMINYGIVYGLTVYGPAPRLQIERRLAMSSPVPNHQTPSTTISHRSKNTQNSSL